MTKMWDVDVDAPSRFPAGLSGFFPNFTQAKKIVNNHFLKSGPDFLMDPRKFRRWMEHLSSKNGNSFHVRLKNLRCGGTINDERCEIHAVSIVKD
jgi:hypothetical protein